MNGKVINFKDRTKKKSRKNKDIPVLDVFPARDLFIDVPNDCLESFGIKKDTRLVFKEILYFEDGDFICVAISDEKMFVGFAFWLGNSSILIGHSTFYTPIPRKKIIYIGELVSPEIEVINKL